ncbi:uncharacterized protein EI97DRAFT_376834 [Westerdykella ornata]|uniref:methylated diphthine methylhydrolase n=1 Tax=Westerdykella ornata TaxID=318751 RepID=A0A6A6JIW1_WESOR|nr:uncharacterized protein EI97DRAFT_376834 [Westerdykella ornata]KAF2276387.1 hypothetical protein EI97DRAFT_376834 [Westerdykella ornata]
MLSIEPLDSLILDLPPSCIEFWPVNPKFALIGTYNLEKQEASQDAEDGSNTIVADIAAVKKTQQRNGSLVLLRVGAENIAVLQTLPTPSAILDIHFAPSYQPPSVFGVATSTGSIGLYQFTGSQNHDPSMSSSSDAEPSISHLRTCQYFPEDVLVTAFAWHPSRPAVAMSLSSGEISLGGISGETTNATLCTHDLEAWTIAFTPDGLGLYSGGDDSTLRFSDVAANLQCVLDESSIFHSGDLKMPWTDKRIHGAGVTAILPVVVEGREDLVLTGSYDDRIRLLELPPIGRRTVLAELSLGGGVWRLKLLDLKTAPTSADEQCSILLLASCMHAGARILRLSQSASGSWHFDILARFEKHKSMNYGSDCQPQLAENGKRAFVTTSFYDRLVCLWQY